ncbi:MULTISPECIES: universal stress protein [unclassified Streptomyces]|uniref:universal stress protein n=1 Tax=unclassified Streptomyces TaxID=2593676 RepID=UPI002E166F1D|nr:universal stress protein [Streptomyces sp. NBC_01186]WSS40282.1 universal stress protein [Streptomyces sp. NBC_01187]
MNASGGTHRPRPDEHGCRANSRTGRGRLVVGVSGSLTSLAGLRQAAEEARRTGDTLLAVIAWEPPEGEHAYLRRPDRAWARHWQREAHARLERAFEEAFGGAPPGADVHKRVVRDTPWRALSEAADRPGDRLVLGVRHTGRGRGTVGRTVRRVLAHARCPVLTVPAPVVPKGIRGALRRVTAADFCTAGLAA